MGKLIKRSLIAIGVILLILVAVLIAVYNLVYLGSRYEYGLKSYDHYRQVQSVSFQGSHDIGEGLLKYTSTFQGDIRILPAYQEHINTELTVLGLDFNLESMRVGGKDYYKVPALFNFWLEGSLPQAVKFPYEQIIAAVPPIEFNFNTIKTGLGALSVFEEKPDFKDYVLTKTDLIPNETINQMIKDALPEALVGQADKIQAEGNTITLYFDKTDKLLYKIQVEIKMAAWQLKGPIVLTYEVEAINQVPEMTAPV